MTLAVKIWNHIKAEPPIAAAIGVIVFFSLPVLISIAARGYILLPQGFTYTINVPAIYGLIAIGIDVLLIFLFAVSPVVKFGFHSIISPGWLRVAFIWFYILLSWTSFFIINAKLNFFSSLIENPLLTMLSLGSELVENKLLAPFFFGISGCISYALISKTDSFFLKATCYFTMIFIAVFYFFVGRREISLMTLCFFLLVRKERLSPRYLASVGAISFAILIFVLALRLDVQDNSEPLYATDSEELSPVAYSAYVIQNTSPDIVNSFVEVSPIRSKLVPNTISAAFLIKQTGYDDIANPVLGIAGVTYMYAFIIPAIELLLIGCVARSVNYAYRIKKTPILKLLLIYMVFKTVNIFRNGEFPIVMIDVLLFFVLALPAACLNFKKNQNVTEAV